MEDDNGAWEAIQRQIQELLSMDFDKAIESCPKLRAYIEADDDPADLMNEFRRSWHPEAPAELLEVLEQILHPEQYEASMAQSGDAAGGVGSGSTGFSLSFDPDEHDEKLLQDLDAECRSDLASDIRDLPNDLRSMLYDARSGETAAHDRIDEFENYDNSTFDNESDSNIAEAVESLLRMPFDDALRDCEPLRKYLAEHGDDSAAVEDEFRYAWSLDAPPELREVLGQFLNPEAGAENARDTSEFLERMLPANERRSKL